MEEGKDYLMDKNWYALRVFYNRVQPLIADCREQGQETG